MTAPAASDTNPPASAEVASRANRQAAATWFVVACFATLSLFVLAEVAWGVVVHGRNWSGAIGYVFDTMQYLAWIREMADHFLSGNLFGLEPVKRNYFNPGLGISALLTHVGVPIPISYALWVPVGIVAVVWSFTRYARNIVEPGWPVVVTLSIALLYKLPMTDLLRGQVPDEYVRGAAYASWDAWPINWSWGYSLTAIAVALFCAGVLVYAKDRGSLRTFSPKLAAIAFFCSWLQPWQGAELLAVLLISELLAGRLLSGAEAGLRREWRLLGTTVLAGVVPLAYYAILGEVDAAWRINGIQANQYHTGVSWWTGIAVLLPLLLLAIPAWLRRPDSFSRIAVRVWPPVAIGEMMAIAISGVGNTAGHALKGVTLPLAALAVTGMLPLVRRIGPRWAVVGSTLLVLGLLTIPGAVSMVRYQAEEMSWPGNGGYFVEDDDLAALRYLERQTEPGSVLASSLVGSMVPWRTDRQTWVGHETWTPRFQARSAFNEVMFVGMLGSFSQDRLRIDPAGFVRSTGARYVIDSCFHNTIRRVQNRSRRQHHLRQILLEDQLRPATESVHRFGCATVFTIRQPRTQAPANLAIYHLDWLPGDG